MQNVRNRKVPVHKELLRLGRGQAESAQADESVIVVAPPEVSGRFVRTVGDVVEVVAFSTLDELDRWRAGHLARPETIQADLMAALGELMCDVERLSRKLRMVLESMAHRATTPTVREMEKLWPSRRSFYRIWGDEIGEPPSGFLRRVRALHAHRLIGQGLTPKEAALVAGFSSVDRMRKQLAMRG